MKSKNWLKSKKQVDNAKLCSEHFQAVAKSDDPSPLRYWVTQEI